jgi:flagellar FliL protein
MSAGDENVAEAAAPPAGKSKVLPALLVMNTLLLTGVLIFVMKRPAAHAGAAKPEAAAGHGEGESGGEGAGHGEEAAGTGPMLRFDNFTVQLKSAESDRYAHFALDVEATDEIGKAVLERRVPPIRDTIISYVSDRTPEELRGSEGLRQLKQAVIRRLDDIIPGRRIRALYVTDFIIQ